MDLSRRRLPAGLLLGLLALLAALAGRSLERVRHRAEPGAPTGAVWARQATLPIAVHAAENTQTPTSLEFRLYGEGLPSRGTEARWARESTGLVVPADRLLLVECVSPGWACSPPLAALDPAAPSSGLHVHPTPTIRLLVREAETGEPARAWRIAIPALRGVWAHATTDDAGHVALASGPAGISMVVACHPDGAGGFLPLVQASNEFLKAGGVGEIYLPSRPVATTLVVRDAAGTPVPDAQVWWVGLGIGPGPRTDRAGECVLRHTGTAQGVVVAPGYAPTEFEIEGEPVRLVSLPPLRPRRIVGWTDLAQGRARSLEAWTRPATEVDGLWSLATVRGGADGYSVEVGSTELLDLLLLESHAAEPGPRRTWLAKRTSGEVARLAGDGPRGAAAAHLELQGMSDAEAKAVVQDPYVVMLAPAASEYATPGVAGEQLEKLAMDGGPIPAPCLLLAARGASATLWVPSGGTYGVACALLPGGRVAHAVLGTDPQGKRMPFPVGSSGDPMCTAPARFLLPDGRPAAMARIRLRSLPVGDVSTVSFHGFVDALGFSLVPCRAGDYEVTGFLPPDNTPLRGTIRLDPPWLPGAPTVLTPTR